MGMSILVVDDSSIMRKMIKETLLAANHKILGEAKSGTDAVELYKSLEPDLVTMDITMHGMDGLEAAREILKYDASALIVFLSNLNEDKYSEDAARLGAKGYLSKHDPKKILELINELALLSLNDKS
jgi:two-component system chemotaxis response regulator CheY